MSFHPPFNNNNATPPLDCSPSSSYHHYEGPLSSLSTLDNVFDTITELPIPIPPQNNPNEPNITTKIRDPYKHQNDPYQNEPEIQFSSSEDDECADVSSSSSTSSLKPSHHAPLNHWPYVSSSLRPPTGGGDDKSVKSVMKKVRSQFSMTNLKQLGKQVKSSFSKSNLSSTDLLEMNNYPIKMDKKNRKNRMIYQESHHHRRNPRHFKTPVENFLWNPKDPNNADPEFKVEITKFPKKNQQECLIVPPNWVHETQDLPRDLDLEKCVGGGGEMQLDSILDRIYKNVEVNKTGEYEKGVEHGKNNLMKDFRRIFMYLSSKAELDTEILTLKYSRLSSPLLAIGSHQGTVKLIQFQEISSSPQQDQDHIHSSLSAKGIASIAVRNEALQGHLEAVDKLFWITPRSNPSSEQLMSSDQAGVIVGWNIFPQKYSVAFLQDRSSSIIRGFSWSPDFSKVCVIFEDVLDLGTSTSTYGLVIGNEEGHKLYGKPLPSGLGQPETVAWISSEQFLIYHKNAAITSHSLKKNDVVSTRYFSEEKEETFNKELFVGLLVKPTTSWEKGEVLISLVWEKRILLLKDFDDFDPITITPTIKASCCDWSPNGVYIAVGGMRDGFHQGQINVYNCAGKLLTILEMSEPLVTRISWNSESSKLASSCGNMLFITSVRPVYKFASNGKIHVYAYAKDGENYLGFWDTQEDNFISQKISGKIVDLRHHGDRFVLLSMNSQGIYCISIINKKGVCVDGLVLLTMLEPFSICLTDVCVTCLSSNSVLFWRYNYSCLTSDPVIGGIKLTRQIHIDDDKPSFMVRSTVEYEMKMRKNSEDFLKPTLDPAVCMDAKNDMLCVARASGKLQLYRLPLGELLEVVSVDGFTPFQILFNPPGCIMALLDVHGGLRYARLTNDEISSTSSILQVDSALTDKGVLNILWCEDMHEFLCAMKTTEMCILHNGIFEKFDKYNALSGYLAGFKNMTIKLLKLDDLLDTPTSPTCSTHLVDVDMQILTFLKESYAYGDPQEISIFKQHAKRLNHARLWNVLGEEELKRKNYEEAEECFINGKNYPAIQFLKGVNGIPKNLQDGEIYAFLEDYDKAAKCYEAVGRNDLTLEMWKTLDEPLKIQHLLGETSSFSCSTTTGNKCSLLTSRQGDEYLASGNIRMAIRVFTMLKEYDRIVDCYMALDDCQELKALAKCIPKHQGQGDHNLLTKIAEKYAFLGFTKDAVQIYLQAQQPDKAVDVALSNLEWVLALELASEHDVPLVAQRTVDMTRHLLQSRNIMEAVIFLKRCGKSMASGKLLATVSLRSLQSQDANLLQLKKMFVMGATLLQKRHHQTSKKSRTRPRQNFDLEDEIDLEFEQSLPKEWRPSVEEFRWMRQTPWRGALGVHYLILLQQKIYMNQFDRALVLAIHLRNNYMDILGPERVNCFIALSAAKSKNTFQCLGALSHLETLDHEEYSDIAMDILTKNNQEKPKDDDADDFPKNSSSSLLKSCCGLQLENGKCPNCELRMPICTISGKLLKLESTWTCYHCGAAASKSKIIKRKNCPVCHDRVIADFY